MTTYKRKKFGMTEKMLKSITFADSERYEIDESKLTPAERIKMRNFLNDKGLF